MVVTHSYQVECFHDFHKLTSMRKTDVLFRISRPDGTQPYTIVKHLDENELLTAKWNNSNGFNSPLNSRPYLCLSFYSIAQTNTLSVTYYGFVSNGEVLKHRRCDSGTMDYFSFHPNFDEVAPSWYHAGSGYERKGIGVDWRKNGIASLLREKNAVGLFLVYRDAFRLCRIHIKRSLAESCQSGFGNSCWLEIEDVFLLFFIPPPTINFVGDPNVL